MNPQSPQAKAMILYFVVQLDSNGPQAEDDGDTAWQSTTVAFGHGRSGVVSDVWVDGYSGRVRATVTRDDFKLPARLAQPLAVAVYCACGSAMRQADYDSGQAICDLEEVVTRSFYRGDAQTVLRQIRLVIARPASK